MGIDKEKLQSIRGRKPAEAIALYDNTRFNNFDNGGMDSSVVKGQFPTGCADPYIMRFNGMYYLYVTTSGLDNCGLRAWKSKNLLDWEPCQGKGLPLGYVVSPKDEDGRYTQNAYAPEVYYINGRFYLIVSPGPAAVSEFRGHRILVADHPEGPFQAHTEQLDRRIDGTLLIDDDERIYFAHATPFGITIHEMGDDVKTLGEGVLIKSSDGTGAWTEGPGFTKVGDYIYLTYTGCHYQTPGYQVIYSVAKGLDKTNIQTVADSFIRGASRVVLLNCDKDEGHVGLGHSINFMGPDLDSRYICYHNLDALYEDGMTHRSFNIDRLLIRDGRMTSVANLKGSVLPKRPFFESYGEEGFVKEGNRWISKEASGARFSAEFNAKGRAKMLFAYRDEADYCFVEADFPSHRLAVKQIEGGKERTLAEGSLRLDYSYGNLQTIRVAYDGELNVYFNNLRKISLKAAIGSGRIGYEQEGDALEIGYSAISDEANGSSDAHEFKQALAEIQAQLYLSEESSLSSPELSLSGMKSEYAYSKGVHFAKPYEYARYNIYVKEDGDYALMLTLPKRCLGGSFALAIDEEEAKAMALPKAFQTEEDIVRVYLPFGKIAAGPHQLTLIRLEDEFDLVSLSFSPAALPFSMAGIERVAPITNGYRLDKENDVLEVEGRRDFAPLSHQRFRDGQIEADIRLDSVTEEKGSIGLMLRQNNYAYSDVPKQDFKDANTHIQGYYLQVKPTQIILSRFNFGDVKSYDLRKVDLDADLGHFHHYCLKVYGNVLEVWRDGKMLFKASDALAFPLGAAALYSYRCKGAYRNLAVSALD